MSKLRTGLLVGANAAAATSMVFAANAYLDSRQETAPAPIEQEDPQQARIDDIEDYFDDMDHIDVSHNVLSDGLVVDVGLELIPENLDELSPEVAENLNYASVRIEGINANETVGGGSGFLLADQDGEVKLVTAGHVVDNMTPGSISAYTNDHVIADVSRFDSYFEDDPNGLEDFAIGTLNNSEGYRSRALAGRDMEANPLRHGEQLYLMNFQDGREIGDAVLYSLVYLDQVGEGGGQFIQALGDVVQGQEEDDVRPGASGGVVVDGNGEVVGISVAIYDSRIDGTVLRHQCESEIFLASRGDGLFGRDIMPMPLQVPATNDECNPGMTEAVIRRVDNVEDVGFFVADHTVAIDVIVNNG